METPTPSQQIDAIIAMRPDWQGDIIARVRAVTMEADAEIVEEVKWKMPTRPEGLPVWSHNGIVCMIETFKNHSTIIFPKGAEISDPEKQFNARLQSKTDRGIQFQEGEMVNEAALKPLILQAVEINLKKAQK